MNEPVRFDEFMRERAVRRATGSTPDAGGRAGRSRGDFLTSPEVGPLFGAVLARALDGWWDDLGRPDPFVVVDAGAGPGTLARSILARAATVRRRDAVRRGRGLGGAARRRTPTASSRARRCPPGRSTASSWPTSCSTTCRSACSCSTEAGGRRYVARRRRTARRGARGRSTQRPAWLPATAPHGARVPWQEAAAAWVDRRAVAAARAGRVVAIDYVTADDRRAGPHAVAGVAAHVPRARPRRPLPRRRRAAGHHRAGRARPAPRARRGAGRRRSSSSCGGSTSSSRRAAGSGPPPRPARRSPR